MARPVRPIVRLFEKLPFEQQKEVLKHLQAAHERSRLAKRAELEQQLAELSEDAPEKPARARVVRSANGLPKERQKRVAKRNGRAASVKPKYRDRKTGETWSGRGRMAGWLKAKQDAGESIETYLLN